MWLTMSMERHVQPEFVWPWEPRKKCVAAGRFGIFFGPFAVWMVTLEPIYLGEAVKPKE